MASLRESSRFGLLEALLAERSLFAGVITTAILMTFGQPWLADPSQELRSALLFAWIFGVMLWCAFGVARHAEELAARLGEPYGTLILTLAVITIEVSLISAIMLTGENDPHLARDTMFAVLMIVLNGMVGTALLFGGIRHRQQHFNVGGATAFLAVIVPLATFALILPDFTASAPGLSRPQQIFFAGVTILLYLVFLAIQTVRHRRLFIGPDIELTAREEHAAHREDDRQGMPGDGERERDKREPRGPLVYHAMLLVLTMLPVVLLSKKLAVFVDFGVFRLGAPDALGGVIIAILVLTPEGLGALHAAAANRLQRSVNICLGSALAALGLAVPAVLLIGLVTGARVELGLDAIEMVLLLLTLLVSVLTFGSGQTNILQGAVHLVLFLAYVVMIFD
jgi:Ca2+:H+ antiporter